MAASASDNSDAAADLLNDTLNAPVEEYQERSRRVRRPHAHIKAIAEVAMQQAGLSSPRRGINLGRIDRPA